MIVIQVADSTLRKASIRAAHPDEDVFVDRRLAMRALEFGFPRLLLVDRPPRWDTPTRVPRLELHDALLTRWEADRRSHELPPTRLEHLTERIRFAIHERARQPRHVDRILSELSRGCGARLPFSLRSFGRRVLEFPSHYTSLHPLSESCAVSRGALKARFRRRELESPSLYLRWFRLLAVADQLSDRDVTVAVAARQLGFTSDGNLCRMLSRITGMRPTELRARHGREQLLLSFVGRHLSPDRLEGWAALDDLFDRRVA